VGFYDESLKTSEDWDMMLRIARGYAVAYVDDVVAQARYHDGNTTGPRSPLFADALDGRAKVLDKFFRGASLPLYILAMKSIAYRNVHTAACKRWLLVGEFRKASRSLGRAFRSGANPVWVLVRIACFAVRCTLLDRFAWGRRLVRTMAEFRRGWRRSCYS
jgi:hypothetical protein